MKREREKKKEITNEKQYIYFNDNSKNNRSRYRKKSGNERKRIRKEYLI